MFYNSIINEIKLFGKIINKLVKSENKKWKDVINLLKIWLVLFCTLVLMHP